MNEDSAFQTQPAYVQRGSSKKKLVVIFLVVLLLVIAGLGALYLIGNSSQHSVSQPTTPVPTETMQVTPTPASSSAQLSTTPVASASSSSVSPASLSVSVLNGSGVAGAAGQVASALKSAGFTSVTTGNASTFTYTGITVHVKKSDYLPLVQKAIATGSPNMKVTTSVDPSISSDIEVIVGK